MTRLENARLALSSRSINYWSLSDFLARLQLLGDRFPIGKLLLPSLLVVEPCAQSDQPCFQELCKPVAEVGSSLYLDLMPGLQILFRKSSGRRATFTAHCRPAK